jgi:hypothetical protein
LAHRVISWRRSNSVAFGFKADIQLAALPEPDYEYALYAASPATSSSSDASSFFGVLTRFEIGHMRIGSAGNEISRSCGSGLIPNLLS